MVTANDITLRDIRNNDQNQLQFSMFVQTNNGQDILLADTVQRALQVSLAHIYFMISYRVKRVESVKSIKLDL